MHTDWVNEKPCFKKTRVSTLSTQFQIDDIYKLKLTTVVEGDQNAPFLIATTLRFKGGCYFSPLIFPLYS